jgi:signal transduction histidine kinase
LFFSIISHDLKSPFNSILGFSDLLVNNAANYDTDKIKIFAKSINTVAGETYHLLENLLKWTRLQQGMIEPDYSVENLLLLSNQIVSLYSELAKTKEIDIENHIEPEIFIYCDIEITKIVIRNFLANAIKFTAPKGNISIWARIIEQMVEIKITDNGIGIEPENIDELFKLNPKGSTKGTSNETGTGIGLYLSKVFIEKQGGKIGVESAPGKGSTFSFTVEKHSKPNI